MKKHNRIFLSFLLLVAVVIAMPASVFAQDADTKELDLSKKGVLSIVLESEEDKSPVSDADVTVYRVADAKVQDSKLVYTCVDKFAGYAKTIDDVKSQETAKELFQYALDHRIQGETRYTDKAGKTQFTDLNAGVYLVSETKGNSSYERFMPFLAVLPYDNKGKWEFNLIAKPKFSVYGDSSESKIDITVTKVWNDDGKNRPDSITAELICNGQVKDSVELNEENGWTHSWKELDKHQTWSVMEKEVPKGYTVTYNKNGNRYTIYNTRPLVKTGQLRWPVPVLAVGGLVLIAAGVLMRCRGKKSDE